MAIVKEEKLMFFNHQILGYMTFTQTLLDPKRTSKKNRCSANMRNPTRFSQQIQQEITDATAFKHGQKNPEDLLSIQQSKGETYQRQTKQQDQQSHNNLLLSKCEFRSRFWGKHQIWRPSRIHVFAHKDPCFGQGCTKDCWYENSDHPLFFLNDLLLMSFHAIPRIMEVWHGS